MQFRRTADLPCRLYNNHRVILTYVKEFLDNMTAENEVQMSGGGFRGAPMLINTLSRSARQRGF